MPTGVYTRTEKNFKTHCVRGHLLSETRRPTTTRGLQCVQCRRIFNRVNKLRKKFGLDIEIIYKLYEHPQVCNICNTINIGTTYFHIDHCHATNKVRGLLCQRCNHGLGLFKDNVEFLKQAINYLEKHNETTKR